MSHRSKHTCIGMDIELVKYGKINIGMQTYINEEIKTSE